MHAQHRRDVDAGLPGPSRRWNRRVQRPAGDGEGPSSTAWERIGKVLFDTDLRLRGGAQRQRRRDRAAWLRRALSVCDELLACRSATRL